MPPASMAGDNVRANARISRTQYPVWRGERIVFARDLVEKLDTDFHRAILRKE